MACEAIHRRGETQSQTRWEESDHQSILATVEAALANREQWEWAKGKLEWNEPSFRRRLKDLLRVGGDGILSLLKPTKDRFIGDVVNARNTWTHWPTGTATSKESPPPLGPFFLSEILNVTLASNLLQLLGFDDDLRHKLIKASRSYRQVHMWLQTGHGGAPPP